MKKIFNIVVLLLLALPVTAQDSQHPLTGTWSFDYQTSFSNMDRQLQERFGKLPAAQQAGITSLYKGRRLIFTATGAFTQILADGRTVTGSWGLSDNGTILKITSPGRHELKQRIKTLSPGTLVLKLEGPNADKAYFSTSYLKRN